jgi:2-iminobutanoate/2-iminopropanoate deaminase
MKEVLSAVESPAPAGPYSPGLVVGDWIFLSGQGGFDPDTGGLVSDDIAGQTAQVFRNIEAVLRSAGAGLDDVASCLVHLSDLSLFEAFNAAYEKHFPGPARPVRTTVRADLVAGMLVEVTVIASKPHGSGTGSAAAPGYREPN